MWQCCVGVKSIRAKQQDGPASAALLFDDFEVSEESIYYIRICSFDLLLTCLLSHPCPHLFSWAFCNINSHILILAFSFPVAFSYYQLRLLAFSFSHVLIIALIRIQIPPTLQCHVSLCFVITFQDILNEWHLDTDCARMWKLFLGQSCSLSRANFNAVPEWKW